MDYRQAIKQLEQFRKLLDKQNRGAWKSDKDQFESQCQIAIKYGELEDIIEQFVGRIEIRVLIREDAPPAIYSNYIEAGYLSGRTTYRHDGYNQLLKIIGKVKRLSENPTIIRDEQSLSSVVRVLNRFRECCQYLSSTPTNERDVQDIIWIMLRSHFDRLDREDTLGKFGIKNYRPDFGIPELYTLIEVKFIGQKSDLASIQEEIMADIPPYLSNQTHYRSLIIFIYDAAHKLRDPRKFIEDLRTIDGIVDVIVVPGIGLPINKTENEL